MSSTMPHTLSALYGLKFNPFTPEGPLEALYVPPRIENFCWRIENAFAREGGFSLISGEPGAGKSVVMRLLAERLARLPDTMVAVISHPQSSLIAILIFRNPFALSPQIITKNHHERHFLGPFQSQ